MNLQQNLCENLNLTSIYPVYKLTVHISNVLLSIVVFGGRFCTYRYRHGYPSPKSKLKDSNLLGYDAMMTAKVTSDMVGS